MLSERDRRLVEAVPYEPSASPAYDELGGFLAWSDEMPADLTPEGHEFVRDLLIARGYVHRQVAPDAWPSADVLGRWREARKLQLAWNGFRRLVLSAEDGAFLAGSMAEDGPI